MASTKTPEQMAEEYSKQITMQDHCDSEAAWYAEKDFLAGYQAAKPQWISVKERLPEIGAPCLVTCHEERYTIAEYDGIKWTTLTLTYTTTSISTPSTPSPTRSPTLPHTPPSPLPTSTIPLGPFTKNVPTLVSSLEKASQHSDTARPARTARRYTEQGQVGSSPGLLSSRRRCGCKQLESASICWSPAASACSQASTVPSSQPCPTSHRSPFLS